MSHATATFGIDLAAQAANTGVCRIDWEADGSGYVHCPGDNGADFDLLAMIADEEVSRVAIDAPFGWPVSFQDALAGYSNEGRWPEYEGIADFEPYRLRATDLSVRQATGLTPLSVSTDRIGVAAIRCARLLTAHHTARGTTIDRTGNGRCIEVYPAAALVRWGLSPRKDLQDPGSYKGSGLAAAARRRRLVERLVEAADGWLEIPEKAVYVCCENDNCLDAVLCALVGRAADLGRVEALGDEMLGPLEGRVVLPHSGSLTASAKA